MKRKTKNAKNTGLRSILFGVGFGAACYFIFVLVLSVAAYLSNDPTGKIKIFSIAAFILSGAVTGFAVTKKSEGSYTALLSALILSLVMLIIGAIISKSAPGIGTVINCVLYVAAAGLFSRIALIKSPHARFRR